MFQALLFFAFVSGCNGLFKIFPYVTLSKNIYNVTDCSIPANQVINYDYDCYYHNKKENGVNECCIDILKKVSNETELNMCYTDSNNSSLYFCNSRIDYFENMNAYLTLSIIGILFLISCAMIFIYCMVNVISKSFFKNRYQPL